MYVASRNITKATIAIRLTALLETAHATACAAPTRHALFGFPSPVLQGSGALGCAHSWSISISNELSGLTTSVYRCDSLSALIDGGVLKCFSSTLPLGSVYRKMKCTCTRPVCDGTARHCHRCSVDGSAQRSAAHRLTGWLAPAKGAAGAYLVGAAALVGPEHDGVRQLRETSR